VTLAPGQVFTRTITAFCLEYEKPLPPKAAITYLFAANLPRYESYISKLRAGSALAAGQKYHPVGLSVNQYSTAVIQRTLWKENMKLSKRPHNKETINEDLFFEMERMRKDNVPQMKISSFADNIWNDIVLTQDTAPAHKPVKSFFIDR